MTCSADVHRNNTLAMHLTENGKAGGRKSGADIFVRMFGKAGFGCYCTALTSTHPFLLNPERTYRIKRLLLCVSPKQRAPLFYDLIA